MRLTLRQLRQVIREAVADTMLAHTDVPPSSANAYQGPESRPSQRGDIDTNKVNMVARIVDKRAGSGHFAGVKQYVMSMDPQDRLVMTADQIARGYIGSQQGS